MEHTTKHQDKSCKSAIAINSMCRTSVAVTVLKLWLTALSLSNKSINQQIKLKPSVFAGDYKQRAKYAVLIEGLISHKGAPLESSIKNKDLKTA